MPRPGRPTGRATRWPRCRARPFRGSWQLTGIQEEPRPVMSEPEQRTGAGSGLEPMGLFIVERRLPKISEHQMAVLQAALTGAAGRFNARGQDIYYLGSIFM